MQTLENLNLCATLPLNKVYDIPDGTFREIHTKVISIECS